MGTKAFHSAIVSLKLPGDMSASEEIAALRAAGIPVDAQCNAESGFLFVRASVDKKTNYFRWFAGDIGSSSAARSYEAISMPSSRGVLSAFK